MRKRRWPRVLIILGILLLALYLAFWWALFNPLEGDVESLAALVPKDVSYMLHSAWGGLRASDFFRTHVTAGRFSEEAQAELDLETTLFGPMRTLEESINASLPGIAGGFSVLEDLAGREVLVAGNLTGSGETLEAKIRNSPWVLLTRISFKAKFMEALKYDFVSSRIPGLKPGRDYYQYDIGREALVDGAPEEARYQYFRRIRDVLVVSNSRDMIEKVVHLGVAGSDKEVSRENLTGGNYWFYWDLHEPPQDPGFTAWVRIARADAELGGEIEGGPEGGGGAGGLLRAFFPVGLTTSLTLTLSTAGPDRLLIGGGVRMADAADTFPEWLYEFHHQEGLPIGPEATACASFVSAEGALGLAWLKMPGPDFLRTILDSLDPGTTELVFGKPGERKDGWSPAQMAADLGGWFEEGVGVAWSRLPEADRIDLDTWDGGDVDPLPAATLVFTLKSGLTADALLDYFRRNHDRFGFPGEPEEQPWPGGPAPAGRLFRTKWPVDRKLSLLDPGFALVGEKFVFCTNFAELTRGLEAAAEKRPSLAAAPRFAEALSLAEETGNLFLFVDGPRLLDFVRDQRWAYAFDASTFNRQRFYNETFIRLTEEHPEWDRARTGEETERVVERRMERSQKEDFPAAVQEYLEKMFWGEPLDRLVLSTAVGGDAGGRRLSLKGALVLVPEEERAE